jgi:hypothetical protein
MAREIKVERAVQYDLHQGDWWLISPFGRRLMGRDNKTRRQTIWRASKGWLAQGVAVQVWQ